MPQPKIERSLPKIERSQPKNDGVLKDSDSDPNSDSESDSEESSDSGSKAPRLTVDVGKLFKGSFTLGLHGRREEPQTDARIRQSSRGRTRRRAISLRVDLQALGAGRALEKDPETCR